MFSVNQESKRIKTNCNGNYFQRYLILTFLFFTFCYIYYLFIFPCTKVSKNCAKFTLIYYLIYYLKISVRLRSDPKFDISSISSR